mgnify:CR=1 FL=1
MTKLRKATQFLFERLQEPSTWRGIVLLSTGLGAANDPDRAEAIVAIGITIAGFIGVFSKEK